MVNLELKKLERQISDTNETLIYQVTGNRDECIHHLLDFLSFLNKNDFYIATTIPEFWSSKGVGTDGRFLRMGLTLALAGVHVKRVFLVSEEEKEEDILQKPAIIKHQEILKELDAAGIKFTNKSNLKLAGCYFGYSRVKSEKLSESKNFGFDVGLAIQGNTRISIYCRPTKEHLTQITFKPETDNLIFDEMQTLFKGSVDIKPKGKCYSEDFDI